MLVVKKHRKLLLNLRDPERLTAVMPTAKAIEYRGKTLVAVPHKEDEVRVLRNLGFDPPAPIATYYEWPGQYTPFVHQSATAEFFTTNPRSFCLNGMGSGKTLAVLWAFDYLRKAGLVKRMLVISPLSTLERAWGDEIFRNFFDMTFCVLHGSREKRHKLLAEDFDIYIINHDGIKSADTVKLIQEREGLDVIVIDEIASFRNSSTERWKALNRIVNPKVEVDGKMVVKPKTWVWGLTGTPTPNAPTDAWAQCKLISPTRVAPYFSAFRDQVMRPVTRFKWAARDSALDTVKQCMQPAIRFSREDCIDLPPTTFVTRQTTLTAEQQKAYNDMLRHLKAEHAGGQITAINEAVKVSKLVQICCLRGGTLVLTNTGWITIEQVRPGMKVWDGIEWVEQGGAIQRGVKPTIICGGIWMTEDHLVLSSGGWVTAREMNSETASGGLNWKKVRLPDCAQEGGTFPHDGLRSVGVPVRLRHIRDEDEPVSSQPAAAHAASLRMSAREPEARTSKVSPIQHMDAHEGSMREPAEPGLFSLRRPWSAGMRTVGEFVRGFLVRCGRWIRRALELGQDRQQRQLRTEQCPLGHPHAAGEKSSGQAEGRTSSHIRSDRNTSVNSLRKKTCRTPAVPVFDLVNCGPRHRFVVRGADGVPRIVHNCGVAYGQNGDVTIPAQPRIELVREIIEQADSKVLVFVPLTAALEYLAAELRKDYTVEVVHGATSKSARDKIFQDFQRAKDPHVIVANPGTLSHGLTLTAANTIVWFAPINSNETFQQANARIVRPGQKLNTLIVNIEATDLERKMYARLQGKQTMQGLLLDLIKEVK